jgi:hypothetical protein
MVIICREEAEGGTGDFANSAVEAINAERVTG